MNETRRKRTDLCIKCKKVNFELTNPCIQSTMFWSQIPSFFLVTVDVKVIIAVHNSIKRTVINNIMAFFVTE